MLCMVPQIFSSLIAALSHRLFASEGVRVFFRSWGGGILKSGCLQSYLEDGDGTDGDQDDDPDVHFGGQPSAVVGIVVLIVFLRMVQHVVIVPPSVLILHTQTAGHFCCLQEKVCVMTTCRRSSVKPDSNIIVVVLWM